MGKSFQWRSPAAAAVMALTASCAFAAPAFHPRFKGYDETVSTRKEYDEPTFAVLCSPDQSRVKLIAPAKQASLDRSYRQRLYLNAEDMVEFVDHDANSTTAEFAKPARLACGKLQLELLAGVANANQYGENGAFPPYGGVSIKVGARTIQPFIFLLDCAGTVHEFGACPDRSTAALVVEARADGSASVAFDRNATASKYDNKPFSQRKCRLSLSDKQEAYWAKESGNYGLGPCPAIKSK